MPMLTLRPTETASMRTRDGVRLDADVYRPEDTGPWPVLLLRQAYGRRVASTVCYAHPRWYAGKGYVVVVQDIRGRGSSEGRFATLESDEEDGADTIAWCAALPDTTGEVGTYGFSYQGINQLLAAASAGPALKAVAPAMIGWDFHQDVVRTGGVPLLAGMMGWAAQVGADSARHRRDPEVFDLLRRVAARPPLDDAVPARPRLMEELAEHHHYLRWMDADPADPLWRQISPAARLDRLSSRRLPMLFIGGWYDYFLPGTLAAWRSIAARQPELTRLVVGPWSHLGWGRRVGEVDFGPEAASDIDRIQLAWFDRWLKGGAERGGAPVRLFDLGTHRWSESDTWTFTPQTFYLGGDGRASVDAAAGWLADGPGEAGAETLVHDPWRPAPTLGGRMADPPGPIDRSLLEQRGDVLTFTGPVLDAPLTLTGTLRASLHVEADASSFDLFCTVSRVGVDGRVHAFAEGALRVATRGMMRAEVDLAAVRMTLQKGERLRLSVAAASFPAYAVNPGNGDPMHTPQIDAQIITLTVHHGERHPSTLVVGTTGATHGDRDTAACVDAT